MELSNIALQQKIAWWSGSDLKVYQLRNNSIVEIDNVANNENYYTTLVLPANAFSRRFHPRPFNNKDKLKKILPSFLNASLFSADADNENITTIASLDKPVFSSFSIKKNILDDFVNKTGLQISPIVEVLPLPLGLAYYAPKNKTSIIVAKLNNEVIAGLVGDTGEIKDFRCLSVMQWKKEAGLTICGWKTSHKIDVYSIGCVFIPVDIKSKEVKLQHFIPVDLAVLYGVSQIYKEVASTQTIATSDTSTIKHKNSFFKSLATPFYLVCLLTVLVLASTWFSGYMLINRFNEIEMKQSKIFESILPNTPQVDITAQVSRRLNELSYAKGEKIMVVAPITQQMTSLQSSLLASKINLKINEVSINDNSFSLRGMLNSLSDVEKVKKALYNATGNNVVLHNAQMIQGQGVDFYMEAKK